MLFYDIVDLDGVVQESLRESIRKEGILIYEKNMKTFVLHCRI